METSVIVVCSTIQEVLNSLHTFWYLNSQEIGPIERLKNFVIHQIISVMSLLAFRDGGISISCSFELLNNQLDGTSTGLWPNEASEFFEILKFWNNSKLKFVNVFVPSICFLQMFSIDLLLSIEVSNKKTFQ